MKYRLERLNQVQYADDELRRKELEAKGFRVVGGVADSETGSIDAGNFVEKQEAGNTEKKKAVKKAKTEKKAEPEEQVASAEEAETAEAEVEDAG